MSVRDVFVEDLVLTFGCLSHGNEVNFRFSFGMHNRDDHASQQTQCHPSLLAIIKSVVLEREGRAGKDFFGIPEVEPMILEIDSALLLIPGKHTVSVHTSRICIKFKRPRAASGRKKAGADLKLNARLMVLRATIRTRSRVAGRSGIAVDPAPRW
jgi:hypothetical protein